MEEKPATVFNKNKTKIIRSLLVLAGLLWINTITLLSKRKRFSFEDFCLLLLSSSFVSQIYKFF